VENILNKFIGNNKAKNIILTGIPGTGKTHSVMEFVKGTDKYDYEFVQFHPSYDYEDFIEGLKPVPSKNGQIEFKLVDGPFKKLCKRAFEDKENKKTYVMIIDEINRANLSRVFGELLYCLEYRGEFVSTKMTTYIESLDTRKRKKFSINEKNIGKFSIPKNVIVLGTMNEVDRSIDAFDLALRRRFIWEDVEFSETALRLYKPFFSKGFQTHIEELIKKANALNTKLAKDIGENYQIGHTYYFKIIDYFNGGFESALCDLWDYHIKSLVREYCKIKFGEHELSKKLQEYKEIVVGDKNCNG
jgi:5-methylcytosine-specific restriction protein B